MAPSDRCGADGGIARAAGNGERRPSERRSPPGRTVRASGRLYRNVGVDVEVGAGRGRVDVERLTLAVIDRACLGDPVGGIIVAVNPVGRVAGGDLQLVALVADDIDRVLAEGVAREAE